MKVIILGSGTYQPELTRHSSSYLVKVGKQNLVFDFGRGVLDQLLKMHVKYHDIDVIFITHTHADHCSELGSFLHIALAEPEKGKFRRKDIAIYGPKGTKKTINHILKAFGLEKFQPQHKVELKELINDDVIKGQGWIVKSYSVKHSPDMECLAYRLESKNKILAYSGDTEDCSGLRNVCQKADVAIIETSWPEELDPKGHMTGEKVGKVARESEIKKLILTHISPYYLENFDIKNKVKEFYKGPVFIAEDLAKIKV